MGGVGADSSGLPCRVMKISRSERWDGCTTVTMCLMTLHFKKVNFMLCEIHLN